jgi:predicted ATPase/Tfp pilus assembly protein PilF
LLTLLGPPGVGKTRLALAVAADLGLLFDHWVCFVELALLRDHQLVLSAIAQALGLRETSDQSLADLIADFVRPRAMLLLLDNFEHVLAARLVVSELLNACPLLRILVTSRESLRLRAERRVVASPLAMEPAVALFTDRAQAVNDTFQLDTATYQAVTAICERLDRLPLAIELAAARVDVLTPHALCTLLDQRLSALTEAPYDMPDRQRTLRDTIAWSYHLLNDVEQTVFRRLGVFTGGCDHQAAVAVCGGARDDIVAHLATLTHKHLLHKRTTSDGLARYTMLETVREYALEQLVATGEAHVCGQRHVTHYVILAEQAAPELNGPAVTHWLQRLDDDLPNMRAALAWSSSHDGGLAALRLTIALGGYWHTRGYLREGQYTIESLLVTTAAAALPDTLRIKGLVALGFLISQRNDDIALAITFIRQSLALARATQQPADVARALTTLGMLARYPGNEEHALALLEEALTILRLLDDAASIGATLNQIGMLLCMQGDYAAAERYLCEALEIERRRGATGQVVRFLPNLAEVALHRNYTDRAHTLYTQTLQDARQIGYPEVAAECLYGLGQLATLSRQYAQATAFYAESLAIFDTIGSAPYRSFVLCDQGYLALRQERYGEARMLFTDALTAAYTRFMVEAVVHSLVGTAAVDLYENATEHVARLLGASVALSERFRIRRDSRYDDLRATTAAKAQAIIGSASYRAQFDAAAATIWRRITRVAFDTTYDAWKAIPLDRIVAEALAD